MLVLNEDQRMLMDSARGAIAAKAPIAMWRQLRAEASPDGFSRAFWRECAEMGWTGVLVPQEFGGIDFGVTGAGLIAREMARTLAPSPFLSTAVLAASALRRSESAAAKAKWLPRITSGEAIVAFAIDEGPRPTDQTQAMAVKSGQDWLVTAAKHFVLDGHVADAFIVESRRFAGTPALFLVEADASGLTRDARTLVDNRRVASVALERVQLPQDAVLGGVSLIEATLDVGRAVVAAALCGVAEEAFARTMSYLKERKQFDRRIGSFQALQHRAAKLHIDIENSWSATLKALQALDADAPSTAFDARDAAFDVAVAKAKASRTACEATAECLQMHGGIGMTDEFDIGLFLKRARVDSVLFGDPAFHAERVAMLLGY
jgi:alkylation response protein AidB-like acyl-CoA dehydrogenase